jgi:hypothetical protein
MDWQDIFVHPFTGVAVVLSTVGQLGFGWFEPIWGLVSATSGYWFPGIAAIAGTALPEFGLGHLGRPLLVGAAILFAAVQLDRLVERARTYIENR